MEKKPDVKEFYPEDGSPTKPTVYVATDHKGIIECTTNQHMQVQDIPLEEYLKQIIREARVYGDSIFPKYEEGGELGYSFAQIKI